MKIKKSQAALGLAALVAVSTIGMASVTLASNKINTNTNRQASSTAEHLMRGNGNGDGVKLTEAERTAKKAEMDAKRTAVEAAISANDYNAWVAAEGADSPILEKINASNFSRFVEAHNLRDQERTIMTELGLTPGEGQGMGHGNGDRDMGLGLNR